MSQVLEKQWPSAGLSIALVSSQEHLPFVNHDLSWPCKGPCLWFPGVSLPCNISIIAISNIDSLKVLTPYPPLHCPSSPCEWLYLEKEDKPFHLAFSDPTVFQHKEQHNHAAFLPLLSSPGRNYSKMVPFSSPWVFSIPTAWSPISMFPSS